MLQAVGLACGRLGACAGQKSRKYNVSAENLGLPLKISLRIWDFLMGNRCSEQCVRTPNDTERSQKAFIYQFATHSQLAWLKSGSDPVLVLLGLSHGSDLGLVLEPQPRPQPEAQTQCLPFSASATAHT